jgi:hypothetical protein
MSRGAQRKQGARKQTNTHLPAVLLPDLGVGSSNDNDESRSDESSVMEPKDFLGAAAFVALHKNKVWI